LLICPVAAHYRESAIPYALSTYTPRVEHAHCLSLKCQHFCMDALAHSYTHKHKRTAPPLFIARQVIGKQWLSWCMYEDPHFRLDISSARRYMESPEEVLALHSMGWLQGGTEGVMLVGFGERCVCECLYVFLCTCVWACCR
jgi:hypothetical protein